jgi:hypothetical protein
MAPGTVTERMDGYQFGKMNVCWMSGSEDAVE